MTPTLWQLYLDLQTNTAYGTSIANPGPSEDQVKKVDLPSAENALVIGPGSPRECEVIRKSVTGSLCTLTAHKPEAKILQDSGIVHEAAYGDMHDMPFPAASFDLIYASNVFEHAFAPYVALMECRRVARDGAVAILILPEFDGPEGGVGPFHLHCLDRRVWAELLRKTGWLVNREHYEPGGEAPGGYHHFYCTAVVPPHPHDDFHKKLVSLKG